MLSRSLQQRLNEARPEAAFFALNHSCRPGFLPAASFAEIAAQIANSAAEQAQQADALRF